jgi:hypothetical protein
MLKCTYIKWKYIHIYQIIITIPIFTADSYKNKYVKVAYESVLILSLMRHEGPLYEQFKSEVQIRALNDYGYTLDQSEAVCYQQIE